METCQIGNSRAIYTVKIRLSVKLKKKKLDPDHRAIASLSFFLQKTFSSAPFATTVLIANLLCKEN